MAKKKPKKARGGGISKVMYHVSEVLQKVIGKKVASRAETTKLMWDYIKKHDLQDPKERRWIIPDATFAEVFGEDRIFMFDLAKVLTKHLTAVR